MKYLKLSNEEKILARLIEENDFREEYLEDLQLIGMDSQLAQLLLKGMTIESPLTNIKDKILVMYGMELANSYAAYKLPNKNYNHPTNTWEEKIEVIRNSLPPEEKDLSYNSVFMASAEAMIDFVEERISKEEYAEKYNDWRQYLEMNL